MQNSPTRPARGNNNYPRIAVISAALIIIIIMIASLPSIIRAHDKYQAQALFQEALKSNQLAKIPSILAANCQTLKDATTSQSELLHIAEATSSTTLLSTLQAITNQCPNNMLFRQLLVAYTSQIALNYAKNGGKEALGRAVDSYPKDLSTQRFSLPNNISISLTKANINKNSSLITASFYQKDEEAKIPAFADYQMPAPPEAYSNGNLPVHFYYCQPDTSPPECAIETTKIFSSQKNTFIATAYIKQNYMGSGTCSYAVDVFKKSLDRQHRTALLMSQSQLKEPAKCDADFLQAVSSPTLAESFDDFQSPEIRALYAPHSNLNPFLPLAKLANSLTPSADAQTIVKAAEKYPLWRPAVISTTRPPSTGIFYPLFASGINYAKINKISDDFENYSNQEDSYLEKLTFLLPKYSNAFAIAQKNFDSSHSIIQRAISKIPSQYLDRASGKEEPVRVTATVLASRPNFSDSDSKAYQTIGLIGNNSIIAILSSKPLLHSPLTPYISTLAVPDPDTTVVTLKNGMTLSARTFIAVSDSEMKYYEKSDQMPVWIRNSLNLSTSFDGCITQRRPTDCLINMQP
jgi:hypothetical protein